MSDSSAAAMCYAQHFKAINYKLIFDFSKYNYKIEFKIEGLKS